MRLMTTWQKKMLLESTKADEILNAIGAMKEEFTTRFDGIETAIGDIKKEMDECTERVSQVELRVSHRR